MNQAKEQRIRTDGWPPANHWLKLMGETWHLNAHLVGGWATSLKNMKVNWDDGPSQ